MTQWGEAAQWEAGSAPVKTDGWLLLSAQHLPPPSLEAAGIAGSRASETKAALLVTDQITAQTLLEDCCPWGDVSACTRAGESLNCYYFN